MDHVANLLAQYYHSPGSELQVGGTRVSAIASDYGTPLFIYDGHVLDRKWELVRRTFPPEFFIFYSVKANPNPAILRHFLTKGCGLEIASGGEFHLALRAGCAPEQILFAGPGKTERELELVLTRGIGEIHLESRREAERVSAISHRLGVQARVALRVNPGGEAQGGAMRMGGKPTPFGVDEEELPQIVDFLRADEALSFHGIHLFTGTQILDSSVLLRQYRKGLEIARQVASRLERPLQTVDFGGGLGIPYFTNEHALDLGRLHDDLTVLVDCVKTDSLFNGTRFVIEPGRYLIGEAGIYVTRVNDIKVSRGKKFLIVDGGMNHHLAASGNLGQVIKRNFPVAVLNKLGEGDCETVDVVGPLCTPLDVLARDIPLPRAEVGDLIGVFQSGAYARAASPLGFLSHLTPPEVLVYEREVKLIRRRGTYDDLCGDYPQM